MDWVEISGRALLSLAIHITLFLFFRRMYQPKYASKLLYLGVFALSYVIMNLINLLNIPALNFLYWITAFNVICVLLYDARIKQSLFFNMLFLVFLGMSDVAAAFIWMITDGKDIYQIMNDDQLFFFSCMLNILMIIIIYKIYIFFVNKKKDMVTGLHEMCFSVFLLILEIYLLYLFLHMADSKEDGFSLLLITGLLVLLNIFTAYIIGRLSNAYKIKYEYEMIKRQNEMQIESYNEMSLQYEKTRKIIHDMKKHLNVIDGLSFVDADGAHRYRAMLEKELDSLYMGFKCSNRIMSIVFSRKIALAEYNKIKVKTDVEDCSFDFVSDIDLTSIFANLWDNAIEACRRTDEEKRYIEFEIKKVNDFILINVKNSFDGRIRASAGRLLSLKENHDGVGLSIIKSTVKKYNGALKVDYDSEFFQTKITLSV